MTLYHKDQNLRDVSAISPLYRAVQDGNEETVREVLASTSNHQDVLNTADPINGWTPLIAACVNGHLAIAKLLLDAGAEQELCDIAGWTGKEYAAFKGHMELAGLLDAYKIRNHKMDPMTRFLRKRIMRPKEPLRSPLQYQTTPSDRRKLPDEMPNRCRMQGNRSQVLITLGPSNTRSSLKALELYGQSLDYDLEANRGTRHDVTIKAGGTSSALTYSIQLPISKNNINKPLKFSAEHLDDVNLVFEIFRSGSIMGGRGKQCIGTGIALLRYLRQGLGPKRESLIRDFTIPLIENGTMVYVGSITFSILVITPFQMPCQPPRASPGFWKKDNSPQVIGHRGFGANSTARTNLQIGENTIQSFLTAASLGVSCIEFDVQLTKDHVPVIFHDFLLMETGGDVPLYTLTYDQFMLLTHSHTPGSDLVSPAEARSGGERDFKRGPRLKKRTYSLDNNDIHGSQDLVERMRYTELGLQNNIKGNLRGLSIQEPSSTLEQLLTTLPESLAFNLEIKHPMLWEAEDRNMELYAIELNYFIDTILTMVFNLYGNRNITLSSFSPEVCILLACKQDTFPILFINKAGSQPAGDVRAASLEGAIEFATAWDLAGIVMLSDPFVMCPRLLTYVKNTGLVVGSYGNLNDEPDCALIQAEAGLDAIMTNKVRLISETLSKAQL